MNVSGRGMPTSLGRSETLGYTRFFGYGGPGGGVGFGLASTASVAGIDPDGTNPVPVDPHRIRDLYELAKIISTMRLSMEVIKRSLFTYPFDVTMGTARNNVLSGDMKDTVIREKWLPELRKMHDWLVLVGFCPYIIKEFDMDLNSSEYLSKSTPKSKPKPKNPSNSSSSSNTVGAGKDKAKEKKKGTKTKKIDKSNDSESEEEEGEEEEEEAEDERGESHRYIYVPSVEMGDTYIYLDKDMNLKLLWVWNPLYLPKAQKEERSTKGYADISVLFIVKDWPTVSGNLTCPMSSVLRQYDYIKTRRCAEILAIKDRFNPVLFFEHDDKTKTLAKSPADELNSQYASGWNMDLSNLSAHAKMRDPSSAAFAASGGRTGPDGRIILPDGRSGSLNATGMGALAEAGITSRTITGKSLIHSDQSYGIPGSGGMMSENAIVPTLDFEDVDPGTGLEGYENSDLKGKKAVSRADPELENPMSGVTHRVKRLADGEKIVELKNETDILLDGTAISDLEFRFARDIGLIVGYPVELLTGTPSSSISKKTGGGASSSKSSGGGGASGGGGGGGSSSRQATGGMESAREYSVEVLKSWKVFYDESLEKIFTQCYADSIGNSKMKLTQKMKRSEWYVLRDVYNFKVSLVPIYPQASFGETEEYLATAVLQTKEFLKLNRARLGLDVSIVDNPVYFKEAEGKLKARYDEQYKMKMATDSALKVQDSKNEATLAKAAASSSSGSGGSKKRKSSGGGDGGKKKKKSKT